MGAIPNTSNDSVAEKLQDTNDQEMIGL